ncbi:MAG: light-harvesting antenna LH1, alpha subunit [Gemmatimonadaceae bacterium]|nr:light-harvesting antenna LH1, alpha subunit [Gemmatimonadaceae bacterium]
MVGIFAFMFALALVIHFILLSTTRYNWLDLMGTQPVCPRQTRSPRCRQVGNDGAGAAARVASRVQTT